ncbi:MAG: hypothetical protein IPM56_05510 [Ignavibacteriales bacterium]|nr:MAG: hypothetical protein IPM56_05510 [Ignavibacteriales bacterium]
MKTFFKISIIVLFACVSSFTQVTKNKIALVMSDESNRVSAINQKKITDQVTTWELLLMKNNIDYEVFSQDEIINADPENFDFLIVATDLTFSEEQWDALKSFASVSGGIYFSSKITVDDKDIKLNFVQCIKQLTGLAISEYKNSKKLSARQVFTGSNRLTKDINDGESILLSLSDELYLSDEGNSNSYHIGYLDNPESNVSASSIVYGYHENFKYVWTGFDITQIIGGVTDLILFGRFFNNCVDWFYENNFTQAGKTSGISKYQLSFSPVINGRIDQTEKILSVLSDSKITADFLVTETAVDDSVLLSNFIGYGNFGLLIPDLNSSIENLSVLLNTLEKNTGKKVDYISTYSVKNVIAYSEQLIESGINSVFISEGETRFTPYFLEESRNLLIIPESYWLDVSEGQLNNILNKAGSVSGSYHDGFMNLPMNLDLCDESTIKNLRKYLSELFQQNSGKSHSILSTNISLVNEWYRLKNDVNVKIISESNSEINIELINKNDSGVDDVFFLISTKSLTSEPMLYEGNRVSNLNFEYNKLKQELRIFVDHLDAYETRRIRVSLNENL